MQVMINGTPRGVSEDLSVAAVVAELTPHQRGVAVAVNGEVVPRAGWAATTLRDGDRVEVLTAAQGG